MQKRVTSGGAYLNDLALVQRNSEETLQRWRAAGDCVQFERLWNRTRDCLHR